MRTRILLASTLLAAAAGCTAIDSGGPGDAPAKPSKEDSSQYAVSGARTWYLVGDALTSGNDAVELTVAGPTSSSKVYAWLDGTYAAEATKSSSGHWTLSLDIKDLPTGDHELLLAADNDHYAFAAVDFKRSHPLYVAVSNDWDTGDHSDDKLERQDRLHANHEKLVITHFVGPYTFTDPTVSASRAQYLVSWLKNYESTKGDEIGLHIHPYCNFVTKAGVTCRTSPSFAKASDTTGYTVILGSYTRTELGKLFAKAKEIFVANGLPTPTSFRAGGWTSTIDVVAAMGANGFVTDASAVNWAKLEEWEFEAGAQLYQWNQQHWMPMDETSQPYYPSTDDVLADAAPHENVLEAVDNGALVDYVSGSEMISMFRANYKEGEALAETKHYSIGYHPVDFSEDFFNRIDTALTEIDKHLAADDHGPVIYARMSDLPKAFPSPN